MGQINRLITISVFIAISMFSHSVWSLDAAELYKERTCIACHGAEGRVPVMSEYPKIAGLAEVYLLAQMKDIKNGSRNNSHAVAMKNIMHLISDEEMASIANWLASLPR